MPSNPYGFYPDRSYYDLTANLAAKTHTHSNTDIILPSSNTLKVLELADDGDGGSISSTKEAAVTVLRSTSGIINQNTVQTALQLPTSGYQRVMIADYSRLYYWLKGGYIYWHFQGWPYYPNSGGAEVKPLGYFKYGDGSPCPIVKPHAPLHYQAIDNSRANDMLCSPTSLPDGNPTGVPLSAWIALHKFSWTNPAPPSGGSGSAVMGCGVFMITGEHYTNTGTSNNPVWTKDRDAWIPSPTYSETVPSVSSFNLPA